MIKKVLFSLVSILLLSACKIDMIIEVKYSELISGEEKFINSLVVIEIPACTELENSELESSSLLQIKQKISYYFGESEYIDCIREEFNSYARFNMPVGLDQSRNNKPFSDDYLNLHSTSKTLIALQMPQKFRTNIAKIEDEAFSQGEIDFYIKLIIDQPVTQKIFGHHLWHGVSIDSLIPETVFILDNESLNNSLNESALVVKYFKTSKVIVEMARAGQIPPILSVGK